VSNARRLISIVVPIFNERDNIAPLVGEITAVMGERGLAYELIVVDDGSTDGTGEVLEGLRGKYPGLRIVELRRNFGQTAAMAAGFDYARGEVVVPLDGDLQNDPADIPRLVARLEEGFDVVSGWRRRRRDPLLTRRIPSWLANCLISVITGVKLHDYGCTLKAYRREIVEHLHLYGEMHRFIPAVAGWAGARVAELEVNHRPRTRGKTKYGLTRLTKVLLDLLTIKFLGSFSTKPLHVFGSIGLVSFLGACVSGAVVLYQKWLAEPSLAMNRNPLLTLTALLIMMSVQFLLMGLLAEMVARTYHESQHKPIYIVRRVLEGSAQMGAGDRGTGENPEG